MDGKRIETEILVIGGGARRSICVNKGKGGGYPKSDACEQGQDRQRHASLHLQLESIQ